MHCPVFLFESGALLCLFRSISQITNKNREKRKESERMEAEQEDIEEVDIWKVNGQWEDIEEDDDFSTFPLVAAAAVGDLTTVRSLLEQGEDKNVKTNWNRTAIWYAAEKGHSAIVQLLLEKGACKQRADHYGSTPLLIASSNGHLSVVQLLAVQGADIERVDSDGLTPLNVATCYGHIKIARFLLGQGANTDTTDYGGQTPLHGAALFGNLELTKLLRANGADLDLKNNTRKRAFDVALKESIKWAIRNELHRRWDEHKRVTTQQNDEAGPQGSAGDDKCKIDDQWEDIDERTLIDAANDDDLMAVRRLLEEGVDINGTSKKGTTALGIAAERGHSAIVQLLLAKGADKEKVLPLWVASQLGHLSVVQLLVEHGADTDVNENRDSPLYNAFKIDTPLLNIISQGGHLNVLRYLLEQGLNRDKADKLGRTPLHVAAHFGHLEIAKLLMLYGADLNARTKSRINNGGYLPIDMATTKELRRAIRDEPRRRVDHGYKRATEHDKAVAKPSIQEEEEREDEQNNDTSHLEEDKAMEGSVADEDQDSEPSDEEDGY